MTTSSCPFSGSKPLPIASREPISRPFSSLPKPRELPVIGSLLRRFSGSLSFFEDLRKLGTVVRFSIANERFLLVNEPEMIYQILVSKQHHFHKGKALELAKKFLGNSVLVSEGREHVRQRKLLQPAFHRSRFGKYAETMAADAAKWAAGQEEGGEINLASEMNRLTLSIVADTLFGSFIEAEAEGVSAALTVVLENFNRMLFPLYDRLWSRLPTAQNRRLQSAQSHLDKTIGRIIRQRREENVDRGDLLSMLLAAEDDESEQRRLSDQEIRDQALTLFLAGHETTATGLSWTWYLLSRHPAIWEKMNAEIVSVIGPDRLTTLDDVEKLPFTRAVFSESMRLYSPIWALGRRAQTNVVIEGFEIPARTIVIISPYLMHRDARYWPAPLRFDPERWLGEESGRPKFAYLPFGAGPRVCMGESFAWTEAVIVLSILSRRWKFAPLSEEPIKPYPTITLRPGQGFPVRLVAAARPDPC